MRRETQSLRPPTLQEPFLVWALTMGETGGSGRNLGLDWESEARGLFA